MRRVAQVKFHIGLAHERGLVGRDEARAFVELADAGGPAVEDTDARRHDGHLRHTDDIDDADQEEVAIGLLADFLAKQGTLEIGKDTGCVHV